MARLVILSAAIALLISCSSETRSADPGPTKPTGSGIDLTAFDKAVRPQDDAFKHVNGA